MSILKFAFQDNLLDYLTIKSVLVMLVQLYQHCQRGLVWLKGTCLVSENGVLLSLTKGQGLLAMHLSLWIVCVYTCICDYICIYN
jgi:hypothetical protein